MSNCTAYRVVAVAGASGGLGMIICKELSTAGFQVIALTRASNGAGASSGDKSTRLEELKRMGAKIQPINYADMSSIKQALSGVQVVLSTLNGAALDEEQRKLIKAAKEAGVKRFIPSEFGIDTSIPTHPEPFAQLKRSIQQEVTQSGMEYSFIFTGFFMDFDFHPWFGFNLPTHIKIVGQGNTPLSFIHRKDIGLFLVQILKHPERSRNKCIRLASDKASFNKVIDMMKQHKVFDSANGKVEYVNRDEVKARLQKANYSPETTVEQLQVLTDEGRAELPNLSNSEYPEVHPVTLDKFIPTMKK